MQQTFAISDSIAFHYYAVQDIIITEVFESIGIALAIAFCVLLAVVRNYIVVALAITAIMSIVLTTVSTTVLMGWKLGALESIIYVVSLGLSVDFVIHAAE